MQRTPRLASCLTFAIALALCGGVSAETPSPAPYVVEAGSKANASQDTAEETDHKATLTKARAVFQKGSNAYSAGDYNTAIVLFEEAYAIKSSPILLKYIAQATFKEGAEAYYRGDYEKARTLFEEAYTIKPAPLLLRYIAMSYNRLGAIEQSTDYLAQYAATSPKATEDVRNILRLLEETNKANPNSTITSYIRLTYTFMGE